jgi:hypothetical protein
MPDDVINELRHELLEIISHLEVYTQEHLGQLERALDQHGERIGRVVDDLSARLKALEQEVNELRNRG